MSTLSEAMRAIAIHEGMRIAELFFAKRGHTVQTSVTFIEFAGMLAIAYEQGIERGLEAAGSARP